MPRAKMNIHKITAAMMLKNRLDPPITASATKPPAPMVAPKNLPNIAPKNEPAISAMMNKPIKSTPTDSSLTDAACASARANDSGSARSLSSMRAMPADSP